MRYIELFEEAAEPVAGQTFFHVTTDNRLKSIMATGLEPGRHRRWRNTYGAIIGQRGVIYLISDFKEAIRFAARQDYYNRLEKKRAKTVILRLRNVPSEGLERDDHIEGQLAGHSWWKTTNPIPANNIEHVIPLTPDLVQQLTGLPPDEPTAKTVSPPEIP